MIVDSGGGISNSKIITEEGKYSLDAVQNNPDIEGSLRQGLNTVMKTIMDSGLLNSDDNWNTFIIPGIYKVATLSNGAITGLNSPPGAYLWGILIVLRTLDCVAQIYIDNNANPTMSFRTTYNCQIEEVWQNWKSV